MSWRTNANVEWLSGLWGVERDHPLARHTSFNIGGPAEFFVETRDPAELVEACIERGVPLLTLGAGTKLLVADPGVEGVLVRCVSRGGKGEGRRGYAPAPA